MKTIIEIHQQPCPDCGGTAVDPQGVWSTIDGEPLDFCRYCGGSGKDHNKPPCVECGALTPEEAETKCICAGDKDSCHGCALWPE